ncbi:aldehyde dehydrogenase family protein, partial [Klebsiella pneumoniae]|nr:aldehyde dehydrogenase family protein [Klebsiella pneumoniae]
AVGETAAAHLVTAKLRNSGQVCISPNRVYVHEAIHDRFVAVVADKVARIRVDQGMQEEFVVGPLIDAAGVDKVAQLVDDATRQGAQAVLGGRRHARGGNFYEPTVLTEVDDTMRIARTEIFGPVFAIYRFGDEDEVARRANDSEYGLVAYVFTRDLARSLRLARRIEAGMVILNSGSVG